ncbi:unnamed protein product [Schistosoma margrebowiei]|uniref:Uncharacterized protein n=1 Tax=Schistosoma margrebowiei TaxID=48269 RepID=A0A3P7WW74_9TREM|nr:unnamed protein product [Schistosoma margrebowiei]
MRIYLPLQKQAGIANTRYGLLVTGEPLNRNQRQYVDDTQGHFDSGYKFYLDDLSISVDTIEETKMTYSHFERLLSLGGFNLTKWTSNSVEVLEFIPEEVRVEGNIIICEFNETSKRTLGIE